MADHARPHYLFVTGKLAEPALRRQVEALSAQIGFDFEIAVMPITVAALMTTEWLARRFQVPEQTTKVILPGLVRGELDVLTSLTSAEIVRGPNEMRELPEFFGRGKTVDADYGKYSIEILAEINHAPRMSEANLLTLAEHYRVSGADVIDLGCDPGTRWLGIGKMVTKLKQLGFRVSVDSFHADEVRDAIAAGAELVLSVNTTNIADALLWAKPYPELEVVVIPDEPQAQHTLETTHARLSDAGIRTRLDPILEPIGFGLTASILRYHAIRTKYPEAKMMMGVGNLTELTEVDSGGMNTLLAGICQELNITSVLTTEVINWARSSVQEFDIARRLMHYSVTRGIVPKRLDSRLVMLRDPKRHEPTAEELDELAEQIKDDNYRIFVAQGELHLLNAKMHLRGTEPFLIMKELLKRDPDIEASHAYYLGYEMAKALTALSLHKNYRQDQALSWGFLTRPETPGLHRDD